MEMYYLSVRLKIFGEPYQPCKTGANSKQDINLEGEISWIAYVFRRQS